MNVSKSNLASRLLAAVLAICLTISLTCTAFQDQVQNNVTPQAPAAAASSAAAAPNQSPPPIADNGQPKLAGQEAFDAFRKSPLALPPFDPEILVMPEPQLVYLREMLEGDMIFYREILREAIDRRNKWGASVALTFKYAGKLLARILRNRRNEQNITPRVEPKKEFFGMVANLVELTLDNSGNLKKNLYYRKDLVDHEGLYNRVNELMEYIKRIFHLSPVGPYLRWDKLTLYKDNATHPARNKPLLDETSDLLAQFRGLGYESCMFAGRRIVNLLRMFSRGAIPSDSEV